MTVTYMLSSVRVSARPGRGLGVVAQQALAFGEIVTVAPIFVTGANVDEVLRAIVRAQLADGQAAAAHLRVLAPGWQPASASEPRQRQAAHY